MGVEWQTIGMTSGEPDEAEAIGSTVVMDFATVLLVFWWGFRLRKNMQAAVCEVGFVVTVVALSEYVHAAAMRGAGCERVIISHRIGCGYTACIGSSTNSTFGYAPTGHEQWWVASSGPLVGLSYLLLFCAALQAALRHVAAFDLGPAGVAGVYDVAVVWWLVWYPVMSLLAGWGDFVVIYGTETRPCWGECYTVTEPESCERIEPTSTAACDSVVLGAGRSQLGSSLQECDAVPGCVYHAEESTDCSVSDGAQAVCLGLPLLFAVVHVAFLCGHSTLRRKAREILGAEREGQPPTQRRQRQSGRPSVAVSEQLPRDPETEDGVWYTVMLPSTVRTGSDLQSESAGLLLAGQEILVTRKEHVAGPGSGGGDRPRLQFVRVGGNSTAVSGWVSEIAGDGTRIVTPRGLPSTAATTTTDPASAAASPLPPAEAFPAAASPAASTVAVALGLPAGAWTPPPFSSTRQRGLPPTPSPLLTLPLEDLPGA